jgi:DNA-binding transcriptional regulator YbjK
MNLISGIRYGINGSLVPTAADSAALAACAAGVHGSRRVQPDRFEQARQRYTQSFHRIHAPHLVALVRAGGRFDKGKLVERPDKSGGDQQAAPLTSESQDRD